MKSCAIETEICDSARGSLASGGGVGGISDGGGEEGGSAGRGEFETRKTRSTWSMTRSSFVSGHATSAVTVPIEPDSKRREASGTLSPSEVGR